MKSRDYRLCPECGEEYNAYHPEPHVCDPEALTQLEQQQRDHDEVVAAGDGEAWGAAAVISDEDGETWGDAPYWYAR